MTRAIASSTDQEPVLIVGAGVAGLSAAAALREAGVGCVVVEASGRIGGRADTVMLGDFAFDRGASWLHTAERNPLREIAEAAGDRLMGAGFDGPRRLMVGGRVADAEERAAHDAAWARFEAVAGAETRDIPIAEAIDGLRDDPWIAGIEAFEACQIAAADPRGLSVQDWRLNALEGSNFNVEGGLGAFVARRLGPAAGAVRLGTPVTAIDWRGPIVAETSVGSIRASACIVTVSTAALEGIRFTPELPVSPAGLPMGLLTKVGLRASGAGRLGLAAGESLSAQIARDAAMLSVIAWPLGADHLVAFIGGPPAWELARAGEAATVDFVRGRLRDWFGREAEAALGEALVADWSADPWVGGAYAYALAGHVGDRARLGTPFADGRMVIAGEATETSGLAGTVGGAWLEGRRAAAAVQAALAR